jgi:hypothetical protein
MPSAVTISSSRSLSAAIAAKLTLSLESLVIRRAVNCAAILSAGAATHCGQRAASRAHRRPSQARSSSYLTPAHRPCGRGLRVQPVQPQQHHAGAAGRGFIEGWVESVKACRRCSEGSRVVARSVQHQREHRVTASCFVGIFAGFGARASTRSMAQSRRRRGRPSPVGIWQQPTTR